MKEWICEEIPAVTIDGKPISTMLHQKQELVRCKDCIHWDELTQACDEIDGIFLPDWFCSDGERKE